MAAPFLHAAAKWNAPGDTIFETSPASFGNGGHQGQVGIRESPHGLAVRDHVARRAPSSARIAVVLIHENRLLREMLASLIRKHPEFNLLAALTEVGAARRRLPDLGSGVVLLNCDGGQEALRVRLATAHADLPDAQVIVIGVQPNQMGITELIEVGARGFIMRDASAEDLFTTISEVVAGEGVLPPMLTASLFAEFRGPCPGDACVAQRPPRFERLTIRERKVTECVERGMGNDAIAHQLGISTHTVKSHMSSVLAKIGLHSRLQLAASTRSLGRP
jgi:two-component system, NarL family, nitrate/nitrite response regulator NarL